MYGGAVSVRVNWALRDNPHGGSGRADRSATAPKNRVAVERLLKLQEMIDLGLQIYTLDAFRAFMSLPIPVFQGRTAFQLIEMGDIDVVYGEIVADYEGGGY